MTGDKEESRIRESELLIKIPATAGPMAAPTDEAQR